MLTQPTATTVALAAIGAILLSSCGGSGDGGDAAAPNAAAPNAAAPNADIVLTPVPKQTVMIDAVAYTAYQNPGETFRIVCQDPCPVAESYIYAKYAGFKAMKDKLIAVTGIDVLPVNVPVDLHLAADPVCPLSSVFAGYSSSTATGSRVCLFEYERATSPAPMTVPVPLTPQNGLDPHRQVLAVHEYNHVIFYVRHFVSYEDFVYPVSFYVTGALYRGAQPTQSLCEDQWLTLPHLFHDLCKQIGLDFGDLKESLIELDQLYQARGGTEWTSVYDYRKILTNLRHADLAATFEVYLAHQYPPNEIGDVATILPAGGTIIMYGGWVTLDVPAGAVAAPTTLDYTFPDRIGHSLPAGWGDFAFANSYYFVPLTAAPVELAQPITLTLKYDPSKIPAGGDESALRIYLAMSSPRQELPGSVVDVVAHTVTAPITALDRFVIEPP